MPRVTPLLSRLAATALLVVGLALTPAGADAGHRHRCGWSWRTVTRHVYKTVYRQVQEPYVRYVTVHDECGCPRQVARTCYRTVEVPVRECVPVTERVKVYH